MPRKDDYAGFVDQQFREIADRELNEQIHAQEEELLSRLRSLGASDPLIEEARQAAREVARAEGKTETVSGLWADALLLQLAKRGLLNARLELANA